MSFMLYFHYAEMCSLILLFLVVDQLIKSNERLIEATELPLAARLMIFIFVSVVKFMRFMLITDRSTFSRFLFLVF